MATIVVISVVVLVLTWFLWPTRVTESGGAPKAERPAVDEAELRAAERDVQEAADEESVRDWGPGTGQKPLP